MKMRHVLLCIGLTLATAASAPGGDDWVTVKPKEFQEAINNPLKGFRNYHSNGYGLLHRQYIGWNTIEVSAKDTVERIIARTNEITRVGGKSFGELNVKLVPRVYLDWDGTLGTARRPKQHWPADMKQSQLHVLQPRQDRPGPLPVLVPRQGHDRVERAIRCRRRLAQCHRGSHRTLDTPVA